MKYEKTGIIVQARLGSTRLPEKIILPFYRDMPIIEILLERLQKYANDLTLVIATSTSSSDDMLAEMLMENDINVYRGSEDDVLERFIGAAREYDFYNLLRICADNPFLDVKGTIALLNAHLENMSDYTGYKVEGDIPSIKSHLGLWGEAVSLKALEKAKGFTEEKIFHEHVTNYLYENKDKFSVKLISAPEILYSRNDIRLTVDTKEDFEMSQEIYSKLLDLTPNFENKDIVKLVDSNEKYLEIMKGQIIANTK